jgi:hypothetical protein
MNEEGIAQLRGTAWQGNVAKSGVTCGIRIVFLSESPADGALLYFHKLMGDAPTLIKIDDKGCDHTPRALKLMPSSDPNSADGAISIFKCEDTEEDESKLEKQTNRHAIFPPRNANLSLSPDGNVLKIIVHFLSGDGTYQLTRQTQLTQQAPPTRDALKSWLRSP